MLQEVKQMAMKIGYDDNITIKSVIDYLTEWYMEHFLGPDKEMGDYLKKFPKK
jgi:hemerythrin